MQYNSYGGNLEFNTGDNMKFEKHFLVYVVILMLIAIGLLAYPVNAETGSIQVVDSLMHPYTIGGGSDASSIPIWNTVYWKTGTYNGISWFRMYKIGFGFPYSYDSTTFNITAGGSGTGVVFYDANTKNITWVFENNNTYTSNPITLTYTRDILSAITSPTPSDCGSGTVPAVSDTQPIGFKRNCVFPANSVLSATYETHMESKTTNYFNVTYFSLAGTQYFNMYVLKGTINTLAVVNSGTAEYGRDTLGISPFNMTKPYLDGISLNISLAGGAYTNQIINTTNWVGYTPPEPSIIIDPITGVGIIFNKESYYLDEIANISWIRTIPTPLSLQDFIILTNPDGTELELVSSPGDSSYIKTTLSQTGTYKVTFRRCSLYCLLSYDLGYDTAVVSPDSPGYILASTPQGAGIPFNVTYAFGYTPLVQGELNSVVIEKLTGDKWEWNNAVSLNNTNIIKNTEYNKTIVLGDIGKYKIKLFELSKGYVAEIAIDSISITIPTIKNITTSIISVDKYEYLTSDYISIYYAIDNKNYSNYYNKYISVVHSSGAYPETSHILVTEQEQIIDYMSANAILQNAKKGLNYVQLRAKNNTADILLTNTSFNISFIDLYGYGLDVVNPNLCKDEYLIIKYATPTNSTLRINTVGTGVPVKYYEINITGVSTFQLKLTKITDYQILIYDGVQQNVKKVTTATTKNCEVIIEPTYKGLNGTWKATNENIQTTCSYWDNCVRLMSSGQGVNDVTRMMFALGCMAVMMFMGMIVSKGNFGVSLILGFIPYAFFSYITISTPCGSYMPLWVTVFLALIIGIKMRWFN